MTKVPLRDVTPLMQAMRNFLLGVRKSFVFVFCVCQI